MANPHDLKFSGRFSSGKRGESRQDQQKAVEEGLDVMREAIKFILSKPPAERDKHLNQLTKELGRMAVKLGKKETDRGARRVQAAQNVVDILKRASDAKR